MKRTHAKKSLSVSQQLHGGKDRTLSLIPSYWSTLKNGQTLILYLSDPKMQDAEESIRGLNIHKKLF